MDDDRRTARIVGLSLTGICSLCFALSALGLSKDQPALSSEAKLLSSWSEKAPMLMVNQTRASSTLNDSQRW
jgi:hypothetical protein